jgi:dolichol-phosphate mannosyltransferase
MAEISVVIPCYQEETVVQTCYGRVTKVMQETRSEYRLIFVDDGSTDNTPVLLESIAAADPHVQIIHLARNFGHQIALTAGLDAAKGDAVIIMDADLQDPPELIPRMLELWKEGAHVVYGQRQKRQDETWLKKATAKLFYRLLNHMTETHIPLDTGDFRLMDRQVVDVLCTMREPIRYLRGMSAWTGFKQVPLLYERQGRAAGCTHYPLNKMIRLAVDGIFSMSYYPLRWITYTGILTLVLSLFFQPHIVMLCLGLQGTVAGAVLGPYLRQIVANTRNRPLYTVVEPTQKQRPLNLIEIRSINPWQI